MKVSVVIPTYNRARYLRDNYRSLQHQALPKDEYELIYVDDGSTDETATIIKAWTTAPAGPRTRYILGSHGGPARARNLGTQAAKSPIIAFIDDDCLADPNWLAELLKTYQSQPAAVGVGGKTSTYPNKVTPLTHQVENSSPTDFPTCNVSYRKDALNKVHGFDEHFPFTGEDADIHWRVARLGPMVHNPKMVVIHPPRPISFWKDLRVMSYLDAEFLLYEKLPREYRIKRGYPLLELIWFHLIKLTLKRFIINAPWIVKNPLVFLQFFILLLLQRLYLLVLIPWFYVQHLMRSLNRSPKGV